MPTRTTCNSSDTPAPASDIAAPDGGRRPGPAGRARPRVCREDRHPPDDPPAAAGQPGRGTGPGPTDRSGPPGADRSDTDAEFERVRGNGLRIDDPGQLAAAVPVLLGFHPADSLVLVATGGPGGRQIGLVVRVDLPRDGRVDHLADIRAVCTSAVDGLLRDRPQGAAVFVFAEGSRSRLPHRRLVEVVVQRLQRHEVSVHSAVWVSGTTAGARWARYDHHGCHGQLPDPAGTAVAVAATVDGRVIRSSRAALAQQLAPVDAERLRRREALLIDVTDTAGRVLDTAVPAPVLALRVVDEAIAAAGEGRLVLDDGRVVALAQALAEPVVRCEAMRRCTGAAGAAAEQLWSALVREIPDPEAAEPAALLAVSALLRGDGALANVALDRAEAAWPGHRLTASLRAITAVGVCPADFRGLLRDSLGAGPPVRPAAGSARTPRRRRPSR